MIHVTDRPPAVLEHHIISDETRTTTSRHHVTEDAVLASEIEQLPDLAGLLKVASRPEWQRITLALPVCSAARHAR